MAPLGVVIGDVVANFELGFGQPGEGAAIEQFGFEAAPKRFGVGVAVAAPAHALHGPVFDDHVFEARGRVLAALVGMHEQPGRGRRMARARCSASLTRSSGIVSRTSQPTILREQRSSHTAKYSQLPPWRGK